MVKRTPRPTRPGKPRSNSRGGFRGRSSAKFKIPKDEKIDYKNLTLIQKYVNDRGKIIPRRVTGITAKQQRQLTTAIKRARYLSLISSRGAR